MNQENTQVPVVIEETPSPAIISGIANIQKGKEIATALTDIVEQQKLYAMITGKKYITVEGWNTLGAMLGCFPEVVRCVKLDRADEVVYESEVVVRDLSGRIVCRAINLCSSKEARWKGRDEYAIMSMSQTRATGKAFRLAFSWIAKLAGYEPTPAEEIPEATVVATAVQPTATPAPVPAEKPAVDVTANGNPKGTITPAQIKKIHAQINVLGATEEEVNAWCVQKFGVRISGLSLDAAKQIIDALEKKITAKTPAQPANADVTVDELIVEFGGQEVPTDHQKNMSQMREAFNKTVADQRSS
jgi:hypothetical protein